MEEMYANLCDFLDAALKINIESNKNPPNYFSVSGYPHYENVISNVLAFFFDYSEEHNFRDLWLKSLIDCYNEKTNKKYSADSSREIVVSREENTGKGRIDIFIECENLIIVIENKIMSDVNNPFDSYHKYALEKAKDTDKQIVEILLTLNENKDHIGSDFEFINITYKKLFEKIKQNRGHYISDEKFKWTIFMSEFINNIDELLEKKNMEIQTEWQRFLKEKYNEISGFFNRFYTDIGTKKDIFNSEMQSIKEKLNKGKSIHISDDDIGMFGMKGNSYFSIFINFKIKGHIIALEVYSLIKPQENRSFAKYYIDIWNRDVPARKSWKNSDVYKTIKSRIQKGNFVCKEEVEVNWGDVLMIDEESTNWVDFNKKGFEQKLIDLCGIIYGVSQEL